MGTIKSSVAGLFIATMLFMPGLSQAALLNLVQGEPTVDFAAGGIVDYNAATQMLTVSAEPSTLLRTDPFIFGIINGATALDDEKLITLQFKVGPTGNFVAGDSGDDLVIKGSVDIDFDGINDYDGVLLTAEVTQFGFEDGGASTDFFEIRLGSVAGLLAPLYGGNDLVIKVSSEVSSEFPNAFNGSFAADFVGQAKGIIGSVSTPVGICALQLDAYCSVGGGPNKSKCRIKHTKSPKHWDWEDRQTSNGHHYRAFTYGMHGHPVPSWANNYTSTNVKFSYVVTNIGTTTVSNLTLADSFDTPIAGLPATLEAGASATVTRTESLRDSIDNVVLVTGMFGAAVCSDSDTVTIKDQLRDRRRHDYDNFRDKGHRDNDDYR